MRADLHVHSTASDGALLPEAVVRLYASLDYDLIAITDHDTINGVESARREAERLGGVRVLSGLEVSAGGDAQVHLLAYGVSTSVPMLQAFLEDLRLKRQERILEMQARLTALGVPVDLTLPQDAADSVGRPHLARALVDAGHVASMKEAFERFLAQGRPAYIPRQTPPVQDAIAFLRVCGGVVSLAHPGQLLMGWDGLGHCLPAWMEAGLQGIEAYHSAHADAEAIRFDRLARRHGLLVTGGSDFHGAGARHDQPGEGLERWKAVHADVEALRALVMNPWEPDV